MARRVAYENTQSECEWAEMKMFGQYEGCIHGWTKCRAPQAKLTGLRCPYWYPVSFKEEDFYVEES